jgi:V/A-type H+-transporting ATPase subunit A
VFWALDADLAYQRHFPAINWLTSHSLYLDNLEEYYRDEIGDQWIEMRDEAVFLLEREAELMEIARLVGLEAISPDNRMIMEGARSIREDFLHQNAFHDVDTYASLDKQFKMLELVLTYYRKGQECLKRGVPIDKMVDLEIREEIAQSKFIPEEQMERLDDIRSRLVEQMDALSE